MVRNIQLKHSGKYVCMVHTEVDTVSAAADLIVRGMPLPPFSQCLSFCRTLRRFSISCVFVECVCVSQDHDTHISLLSDKRCSTKMSVFRDSVKNSFNSLSD